MLKVRYSHLMVVRLKSQLNIQFVFAKQEIHVFLLVLGDKIVLNHTTSFLGALEHVSREMGREKAGDFSGGIPKAYQELCVYNR